jgi:flagellar hook-associated protein 3 FlgL
MAVRVSTSQIAENSVLAITEAYSRFNDAQRKINTGKQLNKPSDDPAGLSQSLDLRERVAELDQFGRTLDQARGFLSTSESALDTVNSLLRNARTIAVQGANDTIDQSARQALSGQIQNIITQVANLGNTSFSSRYVFAGQKTTSPPLQGASTGYTYVGGTVANGDGNLTLDIGRGDTININVTGDVIFTPIIASLTKLRDDVASGATGVISRDDLSDLDNQINTVVSTRADFGARIDRIDETKDRNSLTKVNFTQFISNIEDTDIPTAVVQLQSAQTAYQAALASTAHSFQNSLLDFIR